MSWIDYSYLPKNITLLFPLVITNKYLKCEDLNITLTSYTHPDITILGNMTCVDKGLALEFTIGD